MQTQQIPTVPRLAFSIAETEVALGISRTQLYRLIERGELRSVKVGAKRLVPAAELQRLCGGNTADQAA